MDRVKAVNSIKNPFQDISKELATYNTKDLSVKISFKRIDDVSKDLIDDLMKLIENNVAKFFKSSKIGWNKNQKLKDLTSKNAKFLIAEHKEIFAGFSMFTFDMDYERAVLYCYELQIKDEYQGKGLGRHLMRCMEELAQTYCMEYIVLTALMNNEQAMKFYEKYGFILDETDPESSEYKILSKSTTK